MRDSEICVCCEGIWRLKIPFDDIYTSVFLIRTQQENILVDSASSSYDVDTYILPMLQSFGMNFQDISYLILTHSHGDHAGGMERILKQNAKIKVIKNGCSFVLNGISTVELKGHTVDSIGVYDDRTGTLITGDGLQGYGVGKYRCSLESREDYLQTIEKIKNDGRIKILLFSHAYAPWNKDIAIGRKEIDKCLQACLPRS